MLVHLKEWPCFYGEWQSLVLWTKKALCPNNAKAEVKQCTSNSDLAVPHLLAWLVALGFSRKCQELTSGCLMPHLLTRKYSFSTHTYRKLLSSSSLEVFLRKTPQVLEERQQQRHFPKKVFTWNIFHLSLSVLSPWTSHLSFTENFSGNSTTTKCLHLTTTLTSYSRI